MALFAEDVHEIQKCSNHENLYSTKLQVNKGNYHRENIPLTWKRKNDISKGCLWYHPKSHSDQTINSVFLHSQSIDFL